MQKLTLLAVEEKGSARPDLSKQDRLCSQVRHR